MAKSAKQMDREIAHALSKGARLPHWNDKRGWIGGDSRTLYAFTGRVTGQVVVYPGGYRVPMGPDVAVRIATREEAERLWQSPLHVGWKVA